MVTIRVLQAANTIGGNCIEVQSNSGERIFLDAGNPLDLAMDAVPTVPVGMDLNKPCLGILVSHAHQDHHGLLESLPEDWPVCCGKATWELLSLNAAMRRSALLRPSILWDPKNRNPFYLGPFKIIPILIDHSAFDAYFLLIEVDGKRILYTGDFRDHGRKSESTRKVISNPPPNIDVLIMEGTNLPAKGAVAKSTASESELEDEFTEVFQKTKGRVFVSVASTNIDRLVTLFRACKKSGRVLVVDLYTMIVLRILGKFASLPQPEWKTAPLMAVVTRRMLGLAQRLGYPDLVEELKVMDKAMSARKLEQDKHKWVAMIRSSMVADYQSKGVVADAEDAWIWSLWDGYLRDESQKALFDFFGGPPQYKMHASGHASPETLVALAKAVKPAMLIPVHGTEWQDNSGLFDNIAVRIVANGENVHLGCENCD